jgi:hypothetical protein
MFTDPEKEQYALVNGTILSRIWLGSDWKVYLMNYMQEKGDPVTYYQKSKMWIDGNTLHQPNYSDGSNEHTEGYPSMTEADEAPFQSDLTDEHGQPNYPNYQRQ